MWPPTVLLHVQSDQPPRRGLLGRPPPTRARAHLRPSRTALPSRAAALARCCTRDTHTMRSLSFLPSLPKCRRHVLACNSIGIVHAHLSYLGAPCPRCTSGASASCSLARARYAASARLAHEHCAAHRALLPSMATLVIPFNGCVIVRQTVPVPLCARVRPRALCARVRPRAPGGTDERALTTTSTVTN